MNDTNSKSGYLRNNLVFENIFLIELNKNRLR